MVFSSKAAGAWAVFLLALGPSARAQDAVQVAPDHYKVKVDNASVRVVENTLKPGEKDGMHTHPAGWYYLTLPGKMKIVFADGKTTVWEAKVGEAGWIEAEAAHTSVNVGTTTMGFILVEVKSAAAPAPPQKK